MPNFVDASVNDFIHYWSEFDPDPDFGFVHKEDSKVIREIKRLKKSFSDYNNINSVEEYLRKHAMAKDDKFFHTSLLPQPFQGNLRTAKIFILLLNPGFSAPDYIDESNSDLHRCFIDTIHQNFNNEILKDYPLYFLNPDFCYAGGARWLENKGFCKLAKALVNNSELKLNYLDALKLIARNVAIIEMVPYHSKCSKFGKTVIEKLPSCQRAISFIQSLRKSINEGDDERCLVVARYVKEWKFDENSNDNTSNIIIYGKRYRQSASFSPYNSKGKIISDRGYTILQKLIEIYKKQNS